MIRFINLLLRRVALSRKRRRWGESGFPSEFLAGCRCTWRRLREGRGEDWSTRNGDTRGCVRAMRARGVTPHMAQNTSRRSSAIDGRTTRHCSYALSQRLRKRVEDIFGWMKTGGRIPEDALPRSEPHRGVAMGTRSDVERHVGRGTKAHSPPSHISKTVLSTVYVGGPSETRTPQSSVSCRQHQSVGICQFDPQTSLSR